jgi:hypothetical protein
LKSSLVDIRHTIAGAYGRDIFHSSTYAQHQFCAQ